MIKLLVRALKKIRILHFFNFYVNIILNKKKIRIPIINQIGEVNLEISELWMVDLLKLVLKFGDSCFVDVGVNLGQTLIKLKSVSADTMYIGFEPNPICVFYFNKLLQVNQFSNCKLIPVGVYDKTKIGELSFYSQSTSDSSASVVNNFRPNQPVEKREYVPLFDFQFISNNIGLKSFSVLKIDVEGAELEVIKSFLASIKISSPFILIEILPVYHESNEFRIKRQEEILIILYDLKYSLFRVNKTFNKLLGLVEVKNIEVHSDLNKSEYLFVPERHKENFLRELEKK